MTPSRPPRDPHAAHLLRVEKGDPAPEELAALTAVLLTRVLGPDVEPDDQARAARAVAHWRRPERVSGFEGPRTWRRTAA
ncbi:acyl-CoA carboxylase subunit epsilon [Streptomyces sp. P9(2023)]|uniref:acyl-CoA carboxylase subunit epsilon n=1 Tax=Streptomyces sp. P9(2023) TaxID=3064394 RepID=UPI0028F43771|nr:acyl-CoA carboxylase subunit epsilon [Streptomyces sp. P9(2023)]MDT9693686.1 acyl-CoA carboxylase subunit epsilon [Streptomyces sp. P9(2023)]